MDDAGRVGRARGRAGGRATRRASTCRARRSPQRFGGATASLRGAASAPVPRPSPGGVPLVVGGRVVGGLGVGGADPELCAEIAAVAQPGRDARAGADARRRPRLRRDRQPVRRAPRARAGRRGLGGRPVGGARRGDQRRRPAGAPGTRTSSRRCAHRPTGRPAAVRVRHRGDEGDCTRGRRARPPGGHRGDAAVVSVQNGLGNEEVIAEFVPRVIRGSIVTAGAVTAPGVVRYDAPGDTWFGPFEPSPARMAEVELLAGLLTAGGLPTHRARRRARSAVDQGGLQRGDQPAGCADRADRRPGVHRPGAAGAGGRASSRRRSRSATAPASSLPRPRRRRQDERSRTPSGTSRACCRTSWPSG